MNNIIDISAAKGRDEFYALHGGEVLAHVFRSVGARLSHIVVTDKSAEGIDNTVYMPILKGHAKSISEAEYQTRRSVLRPVAA